MSRNRKTLIVGALIVAVLIAAGAFAAPHLLSGLTYTDEAAEVELVPPSH